MQLQKTQQNRCIYDKKTTKNMKIEISEDKSTATIDGVEYYTSIWVKKSKEGIMYMSQTFKPVQQKYETETYPKKDIIQENSENDGLPF